MTHSVGTTWAKYLGRESKQSVKQTCQVLEEWVEGGEGEDPSGCWAQP